LNKKIEQKTASAMPMGKIGTTKIKEVLNAINHTNYRFETKSK
jgi:hypothetical protein